MLDFLLFSCSLGHVVTVFCHKVSLTQRNANTELKELVSLMPSGNIILLVRDESRTVSGKHLGFYLKSTHIVQQLTFFFKPGTFSKN